MKFDVTVSSGYIGKEFCKYLASKSKTIFKII